MTGPVFRVHGYNWTIGTIEFLSSTNCQLIALSAASKVTIGSLKLEIGNFSTGTTLFYFPTGCIVEVDTITVGGLTMAVTGGAIVNVVQLGAGGGAGRCRVGSMDIAVTALTGAMYGFSGSGTGGFSCGYFTASGGAALTDNASATTSDSFTVENNVNGRLSADKGNADYVVALGDPNIVSFETAFTAIRTITLPSDGNNLHNGLYYEIRVYGAVNGANTLLIKSSATTLMTLATDKIALRYTWRRNATPANGWLLTKYEALP
jgi:hypothetical protein